MSSIQTRKLPKKTIIIIAFLICLAFIIMFAEAFFKEKKIEVYLNSLSYKNVKDITIFHKSEVQDKETKKKSQLYKIKFTDINKNQICKGLLLINIKNKVKVDLDCIKK